jgi:hypothetical protein
MLILKPDPWNADYGAGAEAPFDDDTPVVVDTEVETPNWSVPVVPPPCPDEAVIFVDGVMRIDLRVMAEDGDARAWGLLGSFGAGAVRCDGRASFLDGPEPVGRALILGARISGAPVEATVGNATLRYEPRTTSDDSPQGQRRALQRLMLAAEQRAAAALAGRALVFADGPLHINGGPAAEVVGVVKRMVTAYLDGAPAALLPSLAPGERTPLFALGSTMLDRYAWYQRLLPAAATWHELAGLVRCEVRMELGLDRARRVADRAACLLPRYAGRPGVDPRAPQNLTPVGALESRLRHRLGHSGVVRRALQATLLEASA